MDVSAIHGMPHGRLLTVTSVTGIAYTLSTGTGITVGAAKTTVAAAMSAGTTVRRRGPADAPASWQWLRARK